MHEVLYRRYYRLLTEGGIVSDLLIVDGGYNQLKVAKETLDSLGFENVKIAGLVKDNNHRTKGLINDKGEEIITMTGFVGESIAAQESTTILSSYGDDLSAAASIEYTIKR